MLELLVYVGVGVLCLSIISIYLLKLRKESRIVDDKIEKAIADGIHEPVSLYPFIDTNTCIKSGACITACPEEDILGIRNGRATLINASRCVGHGACFHACPVEAISLRIGTEKRGVDLPHVNQNFETNIQGIFIAGELGGMGLIKNSVDQGRQSVDFITKSVQQNHGKDFDLIIVGAGPAGIAGALRAKQNGLNIMVLEQDTLGGTVYHFPRAKLVMTSPMDLPGYGPLKLYNTSKDELLSIWQELIQKHDIKVNENSKVESIRPINGGFHVNTANGMNYTANKVLLAIGRRGTPRKLGVKGEQLEKVWYKLLDPELISGKDILVVGGGDSAIESALLLADDNQVTLSYRSEKFNRLKPMNQQKIQQAIEQKGINVIFNSTINEILPNQVLLNVNDNVIKINNDLVYVFAGGELPTKFLENCGVEITKRFNYTLLSHK